MKRALLLAAAAALLSTSAFAQVGTGGAAPSTTQPVTAQATEIASNGKQTRSATTGDPNRRICRTQTATGSRLGGAKICKSARDWEEQRAAAKEELERHQRPDGTNGG